MRSRTLVFAGLVVAAGPLSAQVALQTTFTNLHRPVAIAQPPGVTDRMFVVEQRGISSVTRALATNAGRISVWNTASPFSEIGTALTVSPVNTGSEQGLLGIAFHPNYASNGFVFVNLTTNNNTEIRRYTRSSSNPNVFDPASMLLIMRIAQPFSNHNGGTIRFDEQGFLHIGMGDGGSANDPGNRSQDLNNVLGKMLRIDVNGDDFPADATRNYRIPAGNPFAGPTAGADEIWGIGLRNPWKFDIDPRSRNGFNGMTIADVGQVAREEANYELASTPGVNYGWKTFEGSTVTGLSGSVAIANPKMPFYEYGRSGGFSISGGTIYRGVRLGTTLWGDYMIGDYAGWLSWVDMNYNLESGQLLNTPVFFNTSSFTPRLTLTRPVAYESDNEGEVWACSLPDSGLGSVFKLVPSGTASRAVSGTLTLGDWVGTFGPAGVPVEIRMNSNPSAVTTLQVGLSPNGSFRIPVPTGAGRISVNYGSWLRETVEFDTTSADQSGLVMTLRNGDVDGSGEVDLTDIDTIIGNYLLSSNDPGYAANRNSDLNRDGEVDLTDIDIAIGKYLEADELP